MSTKMTMDEKIKRINELYHLSKERALTAEEAAEQKSLRQDYIDSIKQDNDLIFAAGSLYLAGQLREKSE